MADTYPAEVSTFTVTARFIKGIADSADDGLEPDVLPLAGATVTFTPDLSPAIFRITTSTPPLTVFQEVVVATTDADGYLIIPGETTPGVVLPFGGDPDIKPTGWTWKVKVSAGGNFPDYSFSIAGSAGGTVDLTTATPVTANSGS